MAIAASSSSPAPGGTLTERYTRVRDLSIALTAPLAVEDQVVQTIPEVSPTKWHLAHVTWFFERFCLMGHDKRYQPYDERYHYLFNSYYRTVGAMHRRPERGLLSRPTVAEILDYRRHVDDAMRALLERKPDDAALAFVATLGMHHEQQHQELMLTDIKHVLFTNPLGPAYRALPLAPQTPPASLAFLPRPGGICEIGAEGAAFSFDNETPRHRVLLEPHALGNRLINNAEYRDFIAQGGYRKPALWLADGWATVEREGWSRPLCWSEDLEREFTLGGWRELEPGAPVTHVSFYEADAFARWASARLPREAEWEIAARESACDGNLLEAGYLHPVPPPTAGTALGQLYGDVWEWTATPYGPYPGFKPLAGSLGEYNGKFMCNQMVVRGGSCVTSREHIRGTYRSFFYPHDRWQFLGLRLAKGP
jgi:ergothioneine biosynthesis protein EgtB